jgi:hypothetical protein
MVSGNVQEGWERRGWLVDGFDGRYGGRSDGLLMSGAARGRGVMGRSGSGAMIADGLPVRRHDEARGRADEEG